MTSANVVYYYVYRNGIKLLTESQNVLCKNRIDDILYSIDNPHECILVTEWPDEDEVIHENEYNLGEFLEEKTKREEDQRESMRLFVYLKKQGYNLGQIQAMPKWKLSWHDRKRKLFSKPKNKYGGGIRERGTKERVDIMFTRLVRKLAKKIQQRSGHCDSGGTSGGTGGHCSG